MTIPVLFAVLIICILLGVPIGASLIIATSASAMTLDMPMAVLAQKLITSNDSFPLLAVPLFILAGNIMSTGGVSRRLVNFADSLLGWMTGGLGIVAGVTGMFFSAISGSSAATSAAIGAIMLPEMDRHGYDRDFSTAIVAAAGETGIIIPPSMTMVVYGVIAGVSIGDLFMGGILPGILMGSAMCVITYIIAKRRHYKASKFQGFRNVGKTFIDALWGIMMPVIILGGIYGGIFTPTESAAVAVFYGLIVGFFIYKELTWKSLLKTLESSIISSAVIMIIMNAAGLFSYILTREQVPLKLANWFLSITSSSFTYLMLVNVLLLVAGCLLNPSAAVTILAPILVPVAESFGINTVFFGVLMVCNLAIGSLTPPVGTGLFVASSISGVKLQKVARACLPYLLSLMACQLIMTIFPDVITFIPNLTK